MRSYTSVFPLSSYFTRRARRLLFPLLPWDSVGMHEAGAAVVRQRLELGMDQAALAEAAGVDPKTLRSLEQGKSWPRQANRAKIEMALGWTVGSLDAVRSGHPPKFAQASSGSAANAGDGGQARAAADDRVEVSKVWLAKLLLMAIDLDRHRQAAARDLLGLENEPVRDSFSSDLDTLLMRTRSLIDQVEAGVIDSLGGMRSAALVLHRAGIGSMTDLYSHDDHEGHPPSDPPTDGEARTGGAPMNPPVWKGKALEEMSDDELREAAGMDEVWADYVRTKRPELTDWDY